MESKRFIRWWALLLCLLTIIPISASAQSVTPMYSGGSGTKDDPWIIATAEDLVAMSTNYNNGENQFIGKYFKQTADLDMGNYPNFQGLVKAKQQKDKEDPTSAFCGHYDGGGHVISNMTIRQQGYYQIGLFGSLDSRGTVHDVHLDSSCKIYGKGNVGGIVGFIYGDPNGSASVYNCTSGAQVYGSWHVGGIVGDILRNTPQTKNTLAVWHCLNYGKVTSSGGQEDAAGVVGNFSTGGQVIECMNLGTIVAPKSPEVGGIIGFAGIYKNYPVGSGIINCINYGYVYGHNGTGGIVGKVKPGFETSFRKGPYVLHCLNVGAVKSSHVYVGNIVGKTYGAKTTTSLYTGKILSDGNVYDKQEYTLQPICTTEQTKIEDIGAVRYEVGVNALKTQDLVSGKEIPGLERGVPSLDVLTKDPKLKESYSSIIFKTVGPDYEGYSYKKGKYPTLAYWVRENEGEKSTFEQNMASSEKAQEVCQYILKMIDNARSTYLQFRDEDESHYKPYEDADEVGHIATVYPQDAATITKIVEPKAVSNTLFKMHDDTGKQLDPDYRLEVKQYADTVWLKNGDFEKPVFVKNVLPKRIHLFIKNKSDFSYVEEEESTLAPKNVTVKYWTNDIYGEKYQENANAGGSTWPVATTFADIRKSDYDEDIPYHALLKDGKKINTVFTRLTPQSAKEDAIRDAGYFLYDALIPAIDDQPMTVTVDGTTFSQDLYGTDIVSHQKAGAAQTEMVNEQNAWYLRIGEASTKDKDKDQMTEATGSVKIYTAFTGRIAIPDPQPLISRFCQHGHSCPWTGQACDLSKTTSLASGSQVNWKGTTFTDFTNTDIYNDSIVITDKSLVMQGNQINSDTKTPGKGHSTDYLVLGNLSDKEGTAKGMKIIASSLNAEDGSREYYILLYTREGKNWEPTDEISSDTSEYKDANVYYLEGPQIGTFNPNEATDNHGIYRFLNVRNRGDNDGDTKMAPHLFTLTFKDCDIVDDASQTELAKETLVNCYVHGYNYDSKTKKYVDAGVYYYPKDGNYATNDANEVSPTNTAHEGAGAHWQLDKCKQSQKPGDGNYFQLIKGQGKSYTFSLYTSQYEKTEMEEEQDAGGNKMQMIGTKADKPRALDSDTDKGKYNYFGYHYGANSVGIDVNKSIDLASQFQKWGGSSTDENHRFYLIGNTGANGSKFGTIDGWRKDKHFPMTRQVYGSDAQNPDSIVYYATIVRGYDNTGKQLELKDMYMSIASDYQLTQAEDIWNNSADRSKLWEGLWDLTIRPLVQGMKDACATHGALYVAHDRDIRNMNQSLNPNVPIGTQQYVLRMNATTSTYSVNFQNSVTRQIVGPGARTKDGSAGAWNTPISMAWDNSSNCYVLTCQLVPGQPFRFITNNCYNLTWGEDATAPEADESAEGDCNYYNHVLMHESASTTQNDRNSYDGKNVTLANGDKEDLGTNIIFKSSSISPVLCTIRFYPGNNNSGYYTIDRVVNLNNVQDGSIQYTYTDKTTQKEVTENRTIENKGDVAYITSFSSHLAYQVPAGVEAYVVSDIKMAQSYSTLSATNKEDEEDVDDNSPVAVVTLTKPMTTDFNGKTVNFIPANAGVLLVVRSSAENFETIDQNKKEATTPNGYQTVTMQLEPIVGNPRYDYDGVSLLTSNPEGGTYTSPNRDEAIDDDADIIYPFGFYRKNKVVTTETDATKFLFGFWIAKEGEHKIGPNRSS